MRSISATVRQAAQCQAGRDGELRRDALRLQLLRLIAEQRERVRHETDGNARELAQRRRDTRPARETAEHMDARDVRAARLRSDELARAIDLLDHTHELG